MVLMLDKIIHNINKHIVNSIPEIKKYGEVYTPLNIVNEIIELFPNEYWENPKLKILDPANGVGNFPAIIICKLMNGLIKFEEDANKRYKYIIENIIYICEIQEKNINQYLKIFNIGNYTLNYYSGSYLDDVFNDYMIDIWSVNKFDLIIGNPPYQTSGNSRQSISLYHKFIEKSINISKKVSMITPSKWYSNPSMKQFRYNMINNYGLNILNDVPNDIFNTVDIKGGISYFLLDNEYSGNCKYNGEIRTFKHNLISTNGVDLILDKITLYGNYSYNLNSDQYFKIRNKDDRFLDNDIGNCSKCFVSSVNGNIKYINNDKIIIKDNYLKYKVFIPTASGSKSNIGVLGRLQIGNPTDICSRSFVHFAFDSLYECESFISYINTDIIKRLISLKKQTQLVKKDCFSFVPIVPLDKVWNNKMVLDYLDINDEYLNMIK